MLQMDSIEMENVQVPRTDFASNMYGKLAYSSVTVVERNIDHMGRGTAKGVKKCYRNVFSGKFRCLRTDWIFV
jgi:hypothetical protein